LLREEGYGRRIYHSILADYILAQIDDRGAIDEGIAMRIEDLLRTEKQRIYSWLLDRALGRLEERIRRDGYANLLRDYILLASTFAESEVEGSTQRTYRYQSIGRILKELKRDDEGGKYYLHAAREYKIQVSSRQKKFWRSESWFQAGWCYEHADDWKNAAYCYERAGTELGASSVKWKKLLHAELIRCEGECLESEAKEINSLQGVRTIDRRVKEVFVSAEKVFENEVGTGWVRLDILRKLEQMLAYTIDEKRWWEDEAKKLAELMAKEEKNCARGRALFLRSIHDMYLADKIRQVFVRNGIRTELRDVAEFADNKDNLIQSGDWKYIVCLGGPVAKEGLFDWKFEVFGRYQNFYQLLQRSLGYFGAWISTHGQCKFVLLAGVGKYRTFLGVRDMITEGHLHRLLEESASDGLIEERCYEPL